jgi:hypothetical protein
VTLKERIQRLGFPPPGGRDTGPAQACLGAVRAGDQRGERAARQVGERDAVADVTARLGEPGFPVIADPGLEVAVGAEHAAPAVGDLRSGERGEQVADRVMQGPPHPRVFGIRLRAVPVPDRPAADDQPLVGRPLQVGEQDAELEPGSTPGPAGLPPRRRRDRLGGDHM